MIVFTFYGGMEAVIWVEVVQLVIYIGGALAASIVLIQNIDGGLSTVLSVGSQYDKFDVFDFNLDFAKTYTFWGGLLGGCFLTMSTHGTDQYLVQRYLCTSKPASASTALLTSGAVVLAQFIGFLFIGALLFAFYAPFNAPEYAQAGVAGSGVPGTLPFAKPDQVFPNFITEHMPAGLSGLVVAAIFAAALSSSLNSIAATAINDLYKPFAKSVSDIQLLKLSGVLTVVIGVVQILVAIAFMATGESALNLALSVASLFNGPVLGVFLVGTFLKGAKEIHALAGMLASMALMIYVLLAFNGFVPGPRIAWPWYALIGSLTTFAVALAATLFIRNNNDEVIP
jgi:solute:Na+ symporter, SSS family